MIVNRIAVAIFLAPFLLAGCGTDPVASQVGGFWHGPGRSVVEFKANGAAAGNDGCNDVAGNWMSTSDTAGTFKITETGDVGCPGSTGWFDEAATYEISGDKLVIKAAGGKHLAELTRHD